MGSNGRADLTRPSALAWSNCHGLMSDHSSLLAINWSAAMVPHGGASSISASIDLTQNSEGRVGDDLFASQAGVLRDSSPQ